MPEETSKEQPEIPVEQKLELESQQQASAEHQETQERLRQEILPETVATVQSEPVPIQNSDAGNGTTAPVAETPKLAPSRIPPAAGYGLPVTKRTPCPECGKDGWKSEQALKAHIRFAHDVPRKKAELKEQQENPTPPDFSDISGETKVIEPAPVLVSRYESMARMTFDMSTGMMARIFGPEWNPSSEDERAAVVLAIHKYYESVQLPDIPPGYMLCFVCAAYAAPRLGAQPTKTKLQRVWLWLKSKFSRQRVPPMVKNGEA